ncbi:DNA mismatch repair protein Msh3-like [Gigantopelta aegis]|uniref:DNA mismatch repair protein Msh3-like n=1 Tax=Gigantopelta aegis TaxID=1735272 RepID=UPI001B8881E0|nr:DNA mismatch repair protein Msh3-like [Gigantopelta aegis]
MSSKGRKQVTLSKFFTSKQGSITTDENDDDQKKSKSRMKRPMSQDGRRISSKIRRTDSGDQEKGSKSSQPLSVDRETFHDQSIKNHDSTCRTVSETTKNRLSTFSLNSEICEDSKQKNSRHRKTFTDIKNKSDSGILSPPKPVDDNHDSETCMVVSDDDEEEGINMSNSKGKELQKHSKLNIQKSSLCINKTTKTKYTPLETQYLEIKEKYPDAVLFIECGYKYRFFGEDAETASRVLKIFCHPDHNFQTASIPTHRLFVHVRRLVAAGYKVGVVKQTETSALKAAGENRSAPFSRQLSALFTKSTLIGEDVDPLSGIVGEESVSDYGTRPNSFLMCVFDSTNSKKDKQEIAIVAIDPGTGDLIYDCFDDGARRGDLESRIGHVQPVEFLLPATLTGHTQKLLDDVVALSSTDDDRIRVERLGDENFQYAQAFETVSEFYSGGSDLQFVLSLPKPVLSCLAGLIIYLKDFHLDRALKLTTSFQPFSVKSKFMQIGGNTLRNLEVFQNITDGRENGSLFWVLNHTVTKFGSRTFRSWVANPLMDVSEIVKRQNAIQELCEGHLPSIQNLRQVLSKMPDVDKGLCSIYHRKCSVAEFYTVIKSLEKIYKEMKMVVKTSGDQIQSTLIQNIVTDVPDLLADVTKFCSLINDKAAKENDKPNLFTDESVYPSIVERKAEIENVKKQLKDHRKEIRLKLGQPSLDYVTVMQIEFLVEVRNTQLKLVPSNWSKISSTKAVSRFHTPFIVEMMKKLSQLKEQLMIDSNSAWQEFLESFSEKYLHFRRAVQHLSVLDCLFSLARVAQQEGYCRPEITADTTACLDIDEGRHPVIDLLKAGKDQFVPNSTHLSADGKRVMIITGPNMGGKSSYIRQVALITMMAQIGSFIPANSAKLAVVDAIFTRMGAADEIFKGRSTFMVELQEASEIMSSATSRSLVILDELGRGTSTHDGVAIAHATLQYFIKEVKCLTLFVTHYPVLADLEQQFPDSVGNYHMSFILAEQDEKDSSEQREVITFLYQLVEGSAAKSYGLNVARLADMSQEVIKQATEMSHKLETKLTNRRHFCDIFTAVSRKSPDAILKLFDSNDQNR